LVQKSQASVWILVQKSRVGVRILAQKSWVDVRIFVQKSGGWCAGFLCGDRGLAGGGFVGAALPRWRFDSTL
jgi:hypothetical protein